MNTGKIILGTALAAALALPAADALACGHGSMAMPVAAPLVAATVAVPPVGFTVSVLPQGYATVVVDGVTFFRGGAAWYQPFHGPMGHMFHVVPAPHGM